MSAGATRCGAGGPRLRGDRRPPHFRSRRRPGVARAAHSLLDGTIYEYTIGVALACTVVPGAVALLTTTASTGYLVPLIHCWAPI
jgi:hypothetical protein